MHTAFRSPSALLVGLAISIGLSVASVSGAVLSARTTFLSAPSVTNSATDEDTQTTSGLVITPDEADVGTVTHFKILNIAHGTLFKSDGTTVVAEGDFVTVQEGADGLRFTPDADFSGDGSFDVQASTSASDAGVDGGTATATITVNAVADPPSVTPATTLAEVQTTDGLVITISAADGPEVTHFQITNIANGDLFQNDGTTAIGEGDFITVAEGGAGLRFTPASGQSDPGSFDVRAALDDTGTGLSDAATASIAVDKHETTTTILSHDPNPSEAYGFVTIEYSVVSADGGPSPTGDVEVTISGADWGEGCVGTVDDGECTMQLTAADVDRTITVSYLGDATSQPSSDTATHTVLPCAEETVVTSNADAGPGSLRQALLDTCNMGSIYFDMDLVVSPIELTSDELVVAKSVLIEGPGANLLTIRRASGTFRLMEVNPETILALIGVTLADGDATGLPAGGGAIYNNGGGVLILASALTGNTADRGGAIFNDSTSADTFVVLQQSTLSGNRAVDGDGGAVFNLSDVGFTTLLIDTSTISGNLATGNGGGLYSTLWGVTSIYGSTIANNRADSDTNHSGTGGGIYDTSDEGFEIYGSLVAGNFSGASPSTTPDDITATVDEDYAFANLFGVDTNLTGTIDPSNLVGSSVEPIDPRLGPLADNGGPTQTHTLLPGSPAIDAGDNDLLGVEDSCGCTDQRGEGFLRVRRGPGATEGIVDIGAYEADPTIEDLGSQTTDEDTPLAIPFAVGDPRTPFDAIVATSSDTALIPDENLEVTGSDGALTLTVTPAADRAGVATITITATKPIGGTVLTVVDTFELTVTAVADTPTITDAATVVNTQTTSGLVVSTGDADVTHIKVISVVNGALFLNDGVTPVAAGSFVPIADAESGFRFTPALDSTASGTVTIQASVSDSDAGLVASQASATIVVNRLSTSLLLTTTMTPSAIGASLTFTATLSPDLPGALVQFRDGATPLGAPVPTAGGVASFTTESLAAGNHVITAEYGGNTLYAGSVATLTQTVTSGRIFTTGAGFGAGPDVHRFYAVNGVVPIDPLSSFSAFDSSFQGGVRVAEADISGDGVPDVIVAPGPGLAPTVRVFDGADGSEVRSFLAFDESFEYGVFVATGDVDGDGRNDIVTGADAGAGPRVRVFSGMTGVMIQAFDAFDPSFSGGVRVAAGDVNGDGFADIITAMGTGGSTVRIFSGASHTELRTLEPFSDFAGGVWVASGDVNGDGFADVVVGAGEGGTPDVAVLDGPTGTLLDEFLAASETFDGGVRVAAGDVNRDGRAEVIAGLGPHGDGQVNVIDVFNSTTMTTVQAYPLPFDAGVFVATATPENNMVIDGPVAESVVPGGFRLSGWAIQASGTSGSGVDAVDVWAFPSTGEPFFLGGALLDDPRPDIAAIFGDRFFYSGYHLDVPVLPAGDYAIAAYARNARSGLFTMRRVTTITVPAGDIVLRIDNPTPSATVGASFRLVGWGLQTAGAPIDAIHVWAYPAAGGEPLFVGPATLGDSRPDVAALFGPAFDHSGYHLDITTLPPGDYTMVVFARLAYAPSFTAWQVMPLTVGTPPTQVLANIDMPEPGEVADGTFTLSGWAVGLYAPAAPGVTTLHAWAIPVGPGEPRFLGVPTLGVSRPDVAVFFGDDYAASGFTFDVEDLSSGTWDLEVFIWPGGAADFTDVRVVRITVP